MDARRIKWDLSHNHPDIVTADDITRSRLIESVKGLEKTHGPCVYIRYYVLTPVRFGFSDGHGLDSAPPVDGNRRGEYASSFPSARIVSLD